MANGYYTHTTYPATNSNGSSSAMRAELDAIMSAFSMLPNPLGSGRQGFEGGAYDTPRITNGTADSLTIGATAQAPASVTTLAVGQTMSVVGAATFQANVGVTGIVAVNRTGTGTNGGTGASKEGWLQVGVNDGYFFASDVAAGWLSTTLGSVRYVFSDQTFRVKVGSTEYAAWHAGNLASPMQTTGGTFTNNFGINKASPTFSWALGDGKARWVQGVDTNANWFLARYDATGALTDVPMSVAPATGVVSFLQTPTAPTAPAGDSSTNLANTQFVTAAISSALVGQVAWEPRNVARAGYVKLNGALLSRTSYPALWAYAQASGAIVTDAVWTTNSWGCFSTGDGSTTFRIPDLRGEFIRGFDDGRGADTGRGIGTYQASQNLAHSHGGTLTTAAVADHVHTAYTDNQGYHGHGVGDPSHAHGMPPGGVAQAGNDNGGAAAASGPNGYGAIAAQGTYGAVTGIGIAGDGTHAHNVGMYAAGGHAHTVVVNADGGTEARPRNVALLAMIRAL